MEDSIAPDSLPVAADSVFGNLNSLHSNLKGLDDRGLVLSIAAFAEDALGLLLLAFLRPVDASQRLVDGFNAPLGTFSARIKATHALGLITESQFQDLEHFRKIRNSFAHSWLPLDLSHQSISGHVKALNYSSFDDKFPETLCEKLQSSMTSLLTSLVSSANQIKMNDAGAKPRDGRLIPGFSGDFDSQIEKARSQFESIECELKTASGEKREFLKMTLLRTSDRTAFVLSSAPQERRPEALRLCIELKHKASKYS